MAQWYERNSQRPESRCKALTKALQRTPGFRLGFMSNTLGPVSLSSIVNAAGLRTALWRGDLGAELPLVAGCRRSHNLPLPSALGKANDHSHWAHSSSVEGGRQSLRFCGQPDMLRHDRPVVPPQSGVASLLEYPSPSP